MVELIAAIQIKNSFPLHQLGVFDLIPRRYQMVQM